MQGSIYDFLFGGGGSQFFLSCAVATRILLKPSRGSGGMLPRKIFKR